MSLKIQIKHLDKRYDDGTWPSLEKGTPGSAGFDLRAAISEPLQLYPGKTELISTGISIFIEDPNYAAIILPRSGLGHKKGLVLGNGTGLIDSDYQGELMVSAFNRNPDYFPLPAVAAMLSDPITINPGDRIAQLVIIPVANPAFVKVDSFTGTTFTGTATSRGEGGFGHTGVTGIDNASTKHDGRGGEGT